MSTINSQGGENTFADGIVSNLAKKVSLRIRTHIDMDGQCSPSFTTFPDRVCGFWEGGRFCIQFRFGISRCKMNRYSEAQFHNHTEE